MNLLSTFGGGLWLIPTITAIGAIVFGVFTYMSSKSGSTQQTKKGIEYSDKNVPFYQNGYFYFSLICLLATIVIIIWINSEK
jgi:CRISPR/Cas system-associated protein Cas5 (RAMP superfamily)